MKTFKNINIVKLITLLFKRYIQIVPIILLFYQNVQGQSDKTLLNIQIELPKTQYTVKEILKEEKKIEFGNNSLDQFVD